MKIVLMMSMAMAVLGCTRSQQADVDTPQTSKPVAPIVLGGDGSQNGSANGAAGGVSNGGTFATVLDEQALKNYAGELDTANLNYKFSYLGANEQGAVQFNAGKATLVFRRLPVGQAGDLVLELYEGATLKLKGNKTGVILTAGENRQELVISRVDGGGGSTTDLIIDVILGDGGSGGTGGNINPPPGNPPPGGNGGGGGNINPPPGNPPPGGNPPPSGGGVDEIPANWDGKSFLGNDRWKIVPISG